VDGAEWLARPPWQRFDPREDLLGRLRRLPWLAAP